jgi:hypothetical protein
LEWLAPYQHLVDAEANISVKLSMYVRIFPEYEEQLRFGGWRHDWRAQRAGTPVADQQAEIIPVWRRIDLEPITCSVRMGDLAACRKILVPLTPGLQLGWRQVRSVVPKLYGRASRLLIAKNAFQSDSFDAWCAAVQPTQGEEAWEAELDIRLTDVPTEPGYGRVSARVVNRSRARDPQAALFFDANLYAVRMRVEVPEAAHRNMMFRELAQSYRYDLRLSSVGLNAHPIEARRDGKVILETDAVPRKEAGRLEPRRLPTAVPSFVALSHDPLPLLHRILEEMNRYDGADWQLKIDQLTGAQRHEAESDRTRFRRDEINAFRRGIDLLADSDYPNVLRAFRLMNEAMGHLASGKGISPERLAGRRTYDEWRTFQLVFIVAQIPMLAAREHPELAHPDDDRVDILWFAAGGGKTEAFLGLIVWEAFFDRLRGKQFGMSAMVRFPLRLLAFQQLQRTARALAVSDEIRRREKLGGAHFSLGYYVGGTQTPNSISDELHSRLKGRGVDPLDRRITECPYCGADVQGRYDEALRLIEHRCTDSRCATYGERLPLYIVDPDVESYLPTVVVATVDKLAQFGQQQRFANLFGRISLMCGRHGASFLDIERSRCPAAKALPNGGHDSACDGQRVLYPPFKDLGPSLLVQDELHLLAEELGTFDAHYETAVMQLAKTLGSRPWKIVAATATITDFEHHALQLYLKDARQFPAPGPDAFESFYYELDTDRLGRLFVGVLGVGRKHTPSVTRALSLLYQELHMARGFLERAPADMQGATRRYELPPTSEETYRSILFYYELVLTYVLTRKGSDQIAEAIESRVKRELDEVEPGAGQLRIETFNGSVDMGEMVEAMRQIDRADVLASPETRTRGLVTTNIISHGVDVDRFNIIVFAGFTRLVAEYIQASARVGRRFPGISLLIATPQSERDRSIFQRFAKFHEYLDRLIDASAVNRWPIPALERTIPGLLTGYLMGGAAGLMQRRLENIARVQDAIGGKGSQPISEDVVVRWMQEALGSNQRDGYAEEVERVTRKYYARVVNAPRASSPLENLLSQQLGSMRSLRDVDDPAEVLVEGREDVAVMRALRRA